MSDCFYCRVQITDGDDVGVLWIHTQCFKERRLVDPEVVWKRLQESLRILHQDLDDMNARARAVDLLEIMARWLRLGGFPPRLEEEATMERTASEAQQPDKNDRALTQYFLRGMRRFARDVTTDTAATRIEAAYHAARTQFVSALEQQKGGQ